MINQAVEKSISHKFEQIAPFLNEASIRIWAAVEALNQGYGGITRVSRAIRKWWQQMGKIDYPQATELLITADCGSSNSNRARLWKWELQQLATELGLKLHVCHFPPGTSKWNKIEHRLFSQITQNWRGRPLISREVVVNLIANTTTTTGLKGMAVLDEGQYPTGIEINDEQYDSIDIERESFHGEWNYKILPKLLRI
jgi:hypothetical protein